jgi:hypothetical protein
MGLIARTIFTGTLKSALISPMKHHWRSGPVSITGFTRDYGTMRTRSRIYVTFFAGLLTES